MSQEEELEREHRAASIAAEINNTFGGAEGYFNTLFRSHSRGREVWGTRASAEQSEEAAARGKEWQSKQDRLRHFFDCPEGHEFLDWMMDETVFKNDYNLSEFLDGGNNQLAGAIREGRSRMVRQILGAFAPNHRRD